MSYVGQFLVENNLTYMSTTQLNIDTYITRNTIYIGTHIIKKNLNITYTILKYLTVYLNLAP